jgi:hypothetical protein
MATALARTRFDSARIFVPFSISALLTLAVLVLAPASRAADDTARFYGTWQAHILVNGEVVTVISVHDAKGYRNYVRGLGGDTPADDGTFSAANGIYHTSAPSPNAGGVYYFQNNDTAVCTNSAGQIVTWRRIKTAAGETVPQPSAPAPAPPPPPRSGKS